jgi:hypothetical protein
MDMEDRDIPSQMPPQPASLSTPCTLPLSYDVAPADTSARRRGPPRRLPRRPGPERAAWFGGRPSATEAHRSDSGRPSATEAHRAGAQAGGASADEGEAGDARPASGAQGTRGGGGGEESTGARCSRGSGRQRKAAEPERRSPLKVRVRSRDDDAGTAGESASGSGRLEEQGLLPLGRWRMG